MHCFFLKCIWIYFDEFIYAVKKHLLSAYSVLHPEYIMKADQTRTRVDCLFKAFWCTRIISKALPYTFKTRISYGRSWVSVFWQISQIIPTFGPFGLCGNTQLARRHHYQEYLAPTPVVFRVWGIMLRFQIFGFPKIGTQLETDVFSWCVTTAVMRKWAKSFVLTL